MTIFEIGVVLFILWLLKEYLIEKDKVRDSICDYSPDGYHKWSEYQSFGSGYYYQKRICVHCNKEELVEI